MARAAAKRRQPTHHHGRPPRTRTAAAQRFEDTLFFTGCASTRSGCSCSSRSCSPDRLRRLRRRLGVGARASATSSTGNRGGGSRPAVGEQGRGKRPEEPEGRGRLKDLATAYDSNGEHRRRDRGLDDLHDAAAEGHRRARRAGDRLQQQVRRARPTTQRPPRPTAQNAQATQFGPPPTSPLGRALGLVPDPIRQRLEPGANQRFNTALREITARDRTKPIDAYRRSRSCASRREPSAAPARPGGPGRRRHRRPRSRRTSAFVKLAPDDPSAPYAKQQIKALGPPVRQG